MVRRINAVSDMSSRAAISCHLAFSEALQLRRKVESSLSSGFLVGRPRPGFVLDIQERYIGIISPSTVDDGLLK